MSHGGARHGAGRPALHVTAESCRRIDVRDLARAGALDPGAEVMWTWWRDLQGCSIAVDGEVLVLRHSLALKPLAQRAPILRTECHFGGTRPWFGCPACSRRVAVLFLRHWGFACKRCSGVAYTSQREGEWDRAIRARRKVFDQLDAGGRRPKGMRHATHRALMARIAAAEQRYFMTMAGAFGSKGRPVSTLTERGPEGGHSSASVHGAGGNVASGKTAATASTGNIATGRAGKVSGIGASSSSQRWKA